MEPRVCHVVSVTHECHVNSRKAAVGFLQSEAVRQHLAWVQEIGETIYHGDPRRPRQLEQYIVAELGSDYLASKKNKTELRMIKKEMADLTGIAFAGVGNE